MYVISCRLLGKTIWVCRGESHETSKICHLRLVRHFFVRPCCSRVPFQTAPMSTFVRFDWPWPVGFDGPSVQVLCLSRHCTLVQFSANEKRLDWTLNLNRLSLAPGPRVRRKRLRFFNRKVHFCPTHGTFPRAVPPNGCPHLSDCDWERPQRKDGRMALPSL